MCSNFVGPKLTLSIDISRMGALLVFWDNTCDHVYEEPGECLTIDVGNPPFGILDKEGQPDGSDVAVGRQMAKDMGVELEFVQVPSTGRIPPLLAGRADVTIASISITTDRAKTVMYCNPIGSVLPASQPIIRAPSAMALSSKSARNPEPSMPVAETSGNDAMASSFAFANEDTSCL
jgi:Bacterial extracellular solute-binding proteins, family 3